MKLWERIKLRQASIIQIVHKCIGVLKMSWQFSITSSYVAVISIFPNNYSIILFTNYNFVLPLLKHTYLEAL